MEGLVTGIGITSSRPVFELRSDDGEKPQISLGDDLRIQVEPQRICIGYRLPEPESPLLPCPDNVVGIDSSRCPACMDRSQTLPCLRCRGDLCRNPIQRNWCIQPDNHAVYILSFGHGVYKVGVARWTRRRARIEEQGAVAALIVGRADGLLARRMENQIRLSGIPDRLGTPAQLQAWADNPAPAQLLSELRLLTQQIRRRLPDLYWLDESEELSFPNIPAFGYIPQEIDPTRLGRLDAKVVGCAGQVAFVQREGAHVEALNLRLLIGHRLQTPEGGDTYQLVLG